MYVCFTVHITDLNNYIGGFSRTVSNSDDPVIMAVVATINL